MQELHWGVWAPWQAGILSGPLCGPKPAHSLPWQVEVRMLRATECKAVSSCIAITEAPVLSTFERLGWLWEVMGCSIATEFLIATLSTSHRCARRELLPRCDGELCADRSASWMHLSSPAPWTPLIPRVSRRLRDLSLQTSGLWESWEQKREQSGKSMVRKGLSRHLWGCC